MIARQPPGQRSRVGVVLCTHSSCGVVAQNYYNAQRVLNIIKIIFSDFQLAMRPKTAGERNEALMMDKAKKAMEKTTDPGEKLR